MGKIVSPSKKWKVEGHCSYCGECCKSNTIALFMGGFTREYCRYFNLDTKKCKVRIEYEETGKKLKGVPKEHFEYFLIDCLHYPNPRDRDYCPPRHTLPEQCTYRMVKEDGKSS